MRAKEIEAAAIKLPKRERLRLARKLLQTVPIEDGKEDPEILDAAHGLRRRSGAPMSSKVVRLSGFPQRRSSNACEPASRVRRVTFHSEAEEELDRSTEFYLAAVAEARQRLRR